MHVHSFKRGNIVIFSFSSPELQYDHYTAPAAQMELGLLHLETGDLKLAEKTLEASK